MNLGLYFDLRNPSQPRRREWADVYRGALELCEAADRGGIHSLWFSEHHGFVDGYLPQPLTFAAAAAARTERCRLGTSILIAGLRPPALVAEEAAVVDIISGGRLELGVGAGYRQAEFDLYGVPIERRHRLMFETILEVRRLWEQARVTPPPAQERIPIWVGATGPRTARRTGVLGEGLMRISLDLAAPYREGLAQGGHGAGPGRIAGPANLFLSDDPDRDWPRVSQSVAYQWDSYAQHAVQPGGPAPPPIDPDAWRARGLSRGLMNGFALTTPETAAGLLRETAGAAGAETVYLWATLPGLPDALVTRNLELAIDLSRLLAAPAAG